MTICPRHRDLFGSRWKSGRSVCIIPDEIAAHKSLSANGLCGLRSNQSAYVYFKTQQLVPTGSRKSHGTQFSTKTIVGDVTTGLSLYRFLYNRYCLNNHYQYVSLDTHTRRKMNIIIEACGFQ